MELPSSIYYIAGAVILANVGTIATIIFASWRAVWWVSKLDSRVADAKAAAVRAHRRIDLLESRDV